jgi:hypothetical protein
VVIGGSQRSLSAATTALITQIEQELGIKLSAEPKNRAAARQNADDAAARAKAAMEEDLNGEVKAHVEVDTGN